ncbi:Swi3-domain-containing protein [Poronia punctata]|nr:Swi3-domain-containing protein [Poronia punctata]
MASRLVSRPSAPPARPLADINDYDIDDDPFASSGDEAPKKTGAPETQSKKRKDASGLGIDEEVSVAKKARVPRVKLDEARLLSENGIPKLRKKASNLKFKGKGHEFSDAARLLSFYQLWLDDLFPKAKFLDALSMVEKLGHKNNIRLKRIEWINEGKPKAAGFEEDDDDDLFGNSRQDDPPTEPAKLAPIFNNNRATTPSRVDPEDIYDATPKRSTVAAPAAASSLFGGGGLNDEPDEDELDVLMAEDVTQMPAPTSIFGGGTIRPAQQEPDEDDLDALMAEAEGETSSAKTTKPENKAIIIDEEDDLDALMAEAEAEHTTTRTLPTREGGPENKKPPIVINDVDEDEETAMAEMDGLW